VDLPAVASPVAAAALLEAEAFLMDPAQADIRWVTQGADAMPVVVLVKPASITAPVALISLKSARNAEATARF
jgi:hypothetical protein